MINSDMLIIESKILPDVYQKVVSAKQLLRNGDALTIREACKKTNLSRSAFYKYRDSVFDFTTQDRGKTIILFMVLKHTPGILSNIINLIASVKANIITINQTIPIMDNAAITMTIDAKTMDVSPEDLVNKFLSCKGCTRVEIIGME